MRAIRYAERTAAPFGLPQAVTYLGAAEPEGLAIDFCAMQMYSRDRTTAGNNSFGDPSTKLTYTSPSAKFVTNGLGVLVSGTTLRCNHDLATLDTSTTSLHSLQATKTLTLVGGAVTYATGQDVRLTDSSNVNNWMIGRVISWTSGTKTLVLTVYAASSYFAASSWKVIVALGIFIEEQRTNLCLQSQTFDNANWSTGFAAITADAVAAPDGTTTADLLTEDTTATALHRIFKGAVTLAISTAVTFSFYVKRASGSRNVFVLFQNSGNLVYCRVDLSTGTVIQAAAGGDAGFTACAVDSLPNGWFRVKLSGTTSSTVANPAFQIYMNNTATADGSNPPTYTGDGTSGLYLWGAQIELTAPTTAFASSYIPTTTATVTRAADFVSLATSAFALNLLGGTLAFEGYLDPAVDSSSGNSWASIGDGALVNYISVADVGGTRAQVAAASVLQFDSTAGTEPLLGQKNRAALAYATNDVVLCARGVLGALDTSVTLPTSLTIFRLGMRTDGNSSTALNGHILRARYLPRRATDAQLLVMTTGSGTGPELLVNGTFDVDASGWNTQNSTLSVVAGKLRLTSVAAGFAGAYRTVAALTAGKSYLIGGENQKISGANPSQIRIYDTAPGTTTLAGLATSTGSFTSSAAVVVAPDANITLNLCINVATAAGEVAEFDNITFKEILP